MLPGSYQGSPAPQSVQKKCNLPDGTFHNFEIVGVDPVGDICLCKIKNGKNLPFAELGDSDKLVNGQAVIAVGNPFMLGSTDLHPTVSFGLISATHRYQGGYSDAIQTDAAVNPGNSGGPLFSIDGKLLGINGRIAPRFGNRVNSGIGYAIPVNQIKNFMRDFKKGGYVSHARIIGLALKQDSVDGEGAEITNVTKDSTAAKAGFEKGDIVVEMEGHHIHNYWRLLGVLGTYPGGASVKVKVKRAGQTVEITVKLNKTPLPSAAKLQSELGATFEDTEEGTGVRVTKVKDKSDAAKKGLKTGDLILKFNGKEIESAEGLRGLLKKVPPKKIVPLLVQRGDKELDLEVLLDEKK